MNAGVSATSLIGSGFAALVSGSATHGQNIHPERFYIVRPASANTYDRAKQGEPMENCLRIEQVVEPVEAAAALPRTREDVLAAVLARLLEGLPQKCAVLNARDVPGCLTGISVELDNLT